MILYIYGVGSADYVFFWVTFLGREGNVWKLEYWRDVSGVLGLRRVEVICDEFVIMFILLVCVVCDEIVDMVLMCGFSFGVKKSKLVLPFIVVGMIF